ncbi:MAG: SH3 domain-containing protein [Anaerolineae bacterium]|jgi:uncharacterized protein YraI|nr:SH3 domain-containing protein [Anaerolineae bacterium]
MRRLLLSLVAVLLLGAVGLTTTQETLAQGAQTGGNWQAEYFGNNIFTPPAAFIRVDNTIQFNYGGGAPSQGGTSLPADNFSIRWTGTQPITTAGTYQFTAVSEDDVQVEVNGIVIIPFTGQDIAAPTARTGIALLNTGSASIRVSYKAFTGNASINFFYQLTGATGGSTQIPGVIFTPTVTVPPTRTPLPFIPPGALTATVIRASVLNVRDAPSTGGNRLGRILRGETYAVLGRDADARWFLLQLGGYQGWAYGYYLFVNGNEFNAPITSPFGTLGVPAGVVDTGVVTQARATLVLRDVPSVAGNQIGRVTWGAFLPVIGKTGDGFWYQVVWKGTVGWVYSPYTAITQGDPAVVPVR